MCRIWIRVRPPKIFLGNPVYYGANACRKSFYEDLPGIGTGDSMHGVEAHGEDPGGKERFYFSEIKQLFHQIGVIADRINHINLHCSQMAGVVPVKVNIPGLGNSVPFKFLARFIHCIGKRGRSRAAIGNIELDAEISIRSARVVAGRQHYAASGLIFSYQMGNRWRRQQSVLTDHYPPNAVGGGHF